jgi:hypothetical protein
MITPAICCTMPSARVPVISHSDHTTSPSQAARSTVGVMSGMNVKICSQLRRTWPRPMNPCAGCAGVSLR